MSRARMTMYALGLLAAASSMNAAEVDGDGRAKTRMCAGCHGITDYRTAYPQVYAVPRLGGQDAGYIAKALKDYRSGARKHSVMQGMAASLSDKDIADIAAYYSVSVASTPAHGAVDDAARKKADESCLGCHGPQGAKPALPGAPRLAGQQYEYLAQSLRAFRSGARESPMMGAIAKPLSDVDIRSLSQYYSSLPGLRTQY